MLVYIAGSAVAAFVTRRLAIDDAALEQVTIAIAVFGAFGLYGVVYLLLTRAAFRGLAGEPLRRELLRTAAPRRGVMRWLLYSSPASWAISIAFVTVAAVVFTAIATAFSINPVVLVAAIVCIAGSWVMLCAAFAVEYARAWADHDGVRFPDAGARELDDFLYLAVQVTTSFGTNDVEIRSRRARRLVTMHAIVAYVFSSLVIALFASLVIAGLSR